MRQSRLARPTRRTGAILVVDDDESVRQVIVRMLEAAGFEVVAAQNGGDGLAALRSGRRIALVVLDLDMPTMDGCTFRREQLADRTIAHVPVIVLTGAPLQQIEHAQLQADDYVLKPVGHEHLISVVSAYCYPR